MLKLHKRIVSILLTITMALSVIVVAPFSVSGAVSNENYVYTQSMSSNFKSGYTVTGNGASDIVSIAKVQNGRSQSQFGYTEGWCADFVSDCAKIAGQGSAIPFNGGVSYLYTAVLNSGGYTVSTPQAGDLIFYNNGGWCHVGIMVDSINMISGNMWTDGYSKVETIKYTSYKYGDYSYANLIRPKFSTGTHTHNYNTYVYYWKAHPHYSCYQCSCGDIQPNYSKTNYVSTCADCAGVSGAWIKSSKTSLPVGDSNSFTFGANKATRYNIRIDKDGSLWKYQENVTSGITYNFDESGVYTAFIAGLNDVNSQDSSKITFTVFNPIILGESFYANITNSKAGKNISANDEGNVFIETKNDSDNQKWLFELQSDNSYKITNVKYNKCLDVEGGAVANNTNVLVYDSNDKLQQRYYIRYNNTGYGLVPKSCTSSAVDIYGGYTDDGTNIQQYAWNASYAQTFSIDYLELYPNELNTFNGNRYEYYDMTMTWNQAYRFCEKMGGHLVTIGSQEENDFVLALASAYSDGFCWLGGTDYSSEGDWYWVNNEDFSYTNWRSGEPNDTNGIEEYLVMCLVDYAIGEWNDTAFDWSKVDGFVCEYEDEPIDETVYIPSKTAYYNDSKYEIFDYSVDWDTARRICEAKGGKLVEINSQKENEVIFNAIQNTYKTEYWLGITDVYSEGIWSNAEGEILSYTNWLDSQPDNDFNSEEYGLIRSSDGYWADLKSFSYYYHPIGFICEYDTDDFDEAPSETIEANGHTYMYFDTQVSWIQAYKICEKMGGHLVTITSQEENDLVLDLADNYSNERCWLGGADYGRRGDWYWVNSEDFSYSNWNTDEPNNDGGAEYFINMWVNNDKAGTWNDSYYNTSGGFVCEYDDIVEADLYTPTKTIVEGNKQYDVYDVSVDWQTAKNICEEKGGHLVTIESEEENTFIQNLVADTAKAEYWIGLNDLFFEGQWEWLDYVESDYYPWVSGDPNNDFGVEDYIAFNKSNAQWFDLKGFAYSYHSIGFVCETDLQPLLFGDANSDGEVNILDATLVQMYVAKLNVDDFDVDMADYDQSGEVNIQDATAIQMKVAKLA